MTFVHAAVDCRTLANPSSDRRRNWRQTPGLSAQDSSVTPHSSIAATSGHGTAAATGLTLLLSLGTPPHITQAIVGHSHDDDLRPYRDGGADGGPAQARRGVRPGRLMSEMDVSRPPGHPVMGMPGGFWLVKGWSPRPGSNRRHLAYKASALAS